MTEVCKMINCKKITTAHEKIAKFKLEIDKEIHNLYYDNENEDKLNNWNKVLCDIILIMDQCIVNKVYCEHDIDLERDKQPFESWDNKQCIRSCHDLIGMIDNVFGIMEIY